MQRKSPSYGDDGQTAPEFAGVAAVAFAIVSVLIVAAPGFGNTLQAGIEAVICRNMHGRLGACQTRRGV